jgi:hypothetical protein
VRDARPRDGAGSIGLRASAVPTGTAERARIEAQHRGAEAAVGQCERRGGIRGRLTAAVACRDLPEVIGTHTARPGRATGQPTNVTDYENKPLAMHTRQLTREM